MNTTTTIPARRLRLPEIAPRQYAAMARLSGSVELDPALGELVKVRASQLNGCAFCLDMHWKDARARGESEERLYSVATWHEARVFDARERAALALCEAMTHVADRPVPDAVWSAAEAEFEREELGQLVFAIAVINTWNRLNVAVGTEPGHYVPGMFAA
jgi:AhpD family alkylhydroperoxidase